MTTRRKKWLIAAALLVLAAVVGWWWVRRSGPEVRLELRFLSYTNEPVRRVISYDYEEGEVSVSVPPSSYAFVLATNSGTAEVQVFGQVHMSNLVNVGGTLRDGDGFVRPSSQQKLPRILKPGESTILKIGPSQFSKPWSTEILIRRRDLRDTMHDKAMATRKPMFQKWGSRLPGSRAPISIRMGPITNLPPDTARSNPPREARP